MKITIDDNLAAFWLLVAIGTGFGYGWMSCDLYGSQKTASKSEPLPHALDRRGTTGDQDG